MRHVAFKFRKNVFNALVHKVCKYIDSSAMSHAYDDFHLLMPLFVCRRWQGIAQGREGQALKWVRAARLRDYVNAVRACFDTFQNGTKLDFHSESYTLNRMQPFFNPGPLEAGPPSILLGAVGPLMTRTVGEVGDAIQTHPTNSEARYLKAVTRPRLEEGSRLAGRDVRIEMTAGPLIATGATRAEVEEELTAARESLVFTLSTPAYWPALEYHGWREVGEKLRDCTREGRWQDMNALVTDEIMRTFVPSGTYDEIPEILLSMYDGVAERILFPVPKDRKNDDLARKAIERLQAS